MMKIPRILLAGLLVSLAASQSAPAAPIVGTLPIATFGNTLTPSSADLSTATAINWTSTAATSTGTGDFGIIASGTAFSPGATLTLASLGSFSYNFLSGTTNYGTFTAQSAGSFIVQQTPSFLDVYLLGTFTPGPGFASTITANAASLRLSFTYANVGGNVSVSGSGTLSAPPAAPPPGVPEPASLALIGIGLVSVTAFRSLRKRVGK